MNMICLIVCSRAVHSVCLWDDKGPTKVYQALQDDILNFISNAQTVSCSTHYVNTPIQLTAIYGCKSKKNSNEK